MGTYTNIEKALETQLTYLTEPIDIAWPNIKYISTHGTPYLRPTNLPADSDLYTLNDVREHSGIYQIDIFTPSNKGIYRALEIADNIKNIYTSNRTLTAGADTIFIQAVTIKQGEREDAWFKCYIEIKYICYSED